MKIHRLLLLAIVLLAPLSLAHGFVPIYGHVGYKGTSTQATGGSQFLVNFTATGFQGNFTIVWWVSNSTVATRLCHTGSGIQLSPFDFVATQELVWFQCSPVMPAYYDLQTVWNVVTFNSTDTPGSSAQFIGPPVAVTQFAGGGGGGVPHPT